ncbi:MAG: hydrogenase maturation nickel metallochaperone HypA [Pyrinomonadaceae bacterium]
MHEISIAQSICEVAEQAVFANGGGRVISVFLKIGELSGVDSEALDFVWDAAISETSLEGSRLEIEKVPASFSCGACGAELFGRVLNTPVCEKCGSLLRISGGREMEVSGLEIDQ